MRMVGCVVAWMLCMLPFDGLALASPAITESGAVQGKPQNGLTVYQGIPFAGAPVGEMRWREPGPVLPWRGVRNATSFAPACMQKGVSMPGETPPQISEDCLYLNIWTPARSAEARLPVIVWIHGGGYSNGSASMPLYRGDRLARQGVIVVTIAYRLGALGFLAHPELTRESAHHSSGNYGLMDQIAALEWIQRNIAAFGGDPQRVTIAGQSAGAMSVSALMVSPRAQGLFQRAIGQSGGIFEPLQLAPGYLLANAERDGVKLATSLGASSLAQLRLLPPETLLGGGADAVTHPVIEPHVLPMTPYEAYVLGLQADVPLLVGSNAEEARALIDVRSTRASNFGAEIERSVGTLPPALLAAYPYVSDEEAREARLGLERDLRFGWDMWAWARLQAGAGKSPVYYYAFNQRPPFPEGSVYAQWGASHFAELWYMSDHLDQAPWSWSSADRKVAHDMSRYWVNFASAGDPNGKGLVHWPAFTATDNNVMHLGSATGVGGVANLGSMTVFDKVYDAVRGAPFGKQLPVVATKNASRN